MDSVLDLIPVETPEEFLRSKALRRKYGKQMHLLLSCLSAIDRDFERLQFADVCLIGEDFYLSQAEITEVLEALAKRKWKATLVDGLLRHIHIEAEAQCRES